MVPIATYLGWGEGEPRGEYTFGWNLESEGTLKECTRPEREVLNCDWQAKSAEDASCSGFYDEWFRLDGEWAFDAKPEKTYRWHGFQAGVVWGRSLP